MKKPLIAYILRDDGGVKIHLKIVKRALRLAGYRIITGHSLDDIPEKKIKDLDLLIAHLHDRHEVSLTFQKGLREFHDAKFKFVVRLSGNELMKNEFPEYFGKCGNDYYMHSDANVVDAVKYFLADGNLLK